MSDHDRFYPVDPGAQVLLSHPDLANAELSAHHTPVALPGAQVLLVPATADPIDGTMRSLLQRHGSDFVISHHPADHRPWAVRVPHGRTGRGRTLHSALLALLAPEQETS